MSAELHKSIEYVNRSRGVAVTYPHLAPLVGHAIHVAERCQELLAENETLRAALDEVDPDIDTLDEFGRTPRERGEA